MARGRVRDVPGLFYFRDPQPCAISKRPMNRGCALVLFFFLVACSGDPKPADTAAPRSFTLGLIPGAQDFVDFVMDKHGILAAAGLKPERVFESVRVLMGTQR